MPPLRLPPAAAGGADGAAAPACRLLIEVNPHERRVALLEDGRVVEVLLERRRQLSAVGNIYQGRVSRVLPGIQAAFVDLGLARDAFLYVDDARAVAADLEEADGDGVAAGSAPRIEKTVAPGQELLVQVLKDPLPAKGARITTHVTLPGRFVVYLPTLPHVGVSRRVEDEAERARLRAFAERLRPAEGGLIVRTAARGRGEEELAGDLAYLASLWEEVRRRAGAARAPALIHEDLDLPLRVLRDLPSADVAEVWVGDGDTWRRAVEFLHRLRSPLVDRVRLEAAGAPLFERCGVEGEIAAALKSRVWLRSGGYLVISPTEALVSIDVNTGRYVGRSSLEETVVRINLEAAAEVVRQIRLRDLAGILVVDFIDMVDPENRRRVFAALERELKRDRAKNRVLAISDFGLVEITRKRSRANLYSLLTQPCPCCEASGRVKSVPAICLDLRRQLLARRGELAGRPELRLEVHPEVARALAGPERPVVEELERELGATLRVEARRELGREQFLLAEGPAPQAGHGGPVVDG